MRFKMLILIFSFICSVNIAFAYRPFSTEDAGVAGKKVFQAEFGIDYLKWNGDKEFVFSVVPIYGVTENIELSLEIPYMIHKNKDSQTRGIGDINVVLKYNIFKYNIFKEKEIIPAITLKGVVKLDNGDLNKGLGSGDVDYSLFVVGTKNIKNLTFHGHIGYTWIGKNKDNNLRDIFLYAIAIDYSFNEKINLVAELSGNAHPDKNATTNPLNATIGLIYKLTDKIFLDGALRQGLTSSTPDLSTTLGLSITF